MVRYWCKAVDVVRNASVFVNRNWKLKNQKMVVLLLASRNSRDDLARFANVTRLNFMTVSKVNSSRPDYCVTSF